MKFEYFTPETGSEKTVKHNPPFLSYHLLKSFLREAAGHLTQLPAQGSGEPRAECIAVPATHTHTQYACPEKGCQKEKEGSSEEKG